MSDLRTIMEREVAGATPPPDGFERMLRRRDRKRRNQRITAGVVGIAVFAAAVWFVTSALPFDRGETPADSLEPTVAPGPASVAGLIGLPPEGAAPSTPTEGTLVLSFVFDPTPGDADRFHVDLYEDGRLISWRIGSFGSTTPQRGSLEQRLTPEGVELVRTEVISTGLFDHDRSLESAYGLNAGRVEVRNGGRLVRVIWGGCCDQASDELTREMPTPGQVSALQRLDARLADPASWLPASAWEDQEIKPYVSSRYGVYYETHQGIGLDRVVAAFPQRVEELLRAWDTTREAIPQLGGPPLVVWHSDITLEEARALAQILEEAGIQGHDIGDELSYELPGTDIELQLAPLLPDEA